MTDQDKLDAADVNFLLQLIAQARGAGISEITYRSCHIRFSSMIKEPAVAKVSPTQHWQNSMKLGQTGEQ